MEIRHPELDEVYAGAIFVVLAVAAIYFFRVVVVPIVFPPKVILAVPFSPQAPTDNWARNEDCEETSITMVSSFLTGNTSDRLNAQDTQTVINNLKAWEQANLGYNANTGVGATTKMAEGGAHLKITQIQNFTEADLKAAISAGHPILLPLNAKLLPNTHYVNGGPLYHMIVIRGYKGDTFIINDPGTDKGDGNEYSFDVLQKAAADWNQVTKSIDNNRKFALVVSK